MSRLIGILALTAALALGACASLPSPPSSPPPAPAATPTPEPPFACAMPVVAGVLPSDRLVGVEVSSAIGFDRITFRFAPPDLAASPPPVAATGELREARPPFVQGASGLPLDVEGDRFVSVVFRGMVVADEAGRPTYQGPAALRPEYPAVRHLVLSEAFEGVVSWILGIRGPGCLRVLRDPALPVVYLDVAHP